jgi:hypothetical protein
MKTCIVLGLTLLAACGHAGSDTTPKRSSMAQRRDAMCACKDPACATALNADYASFRTAEIARTQETIKPADVVTYETCWTRALGDDILGSLRSLQAKACACTAASCVTAVAQEYADWGYGLAAQAGGDPELDETLEAQIAPLVAEYSACIDDIDMGLARLTRFTERMCACPDRSCATAVQDEYARWALDAAERRRESTKRPDVSVVDDVKDAASAYGECLTTRLAPPP